MSDREREILKSILKDASSKGLPTNIGTEHRSMLDIIANKACEGTNKAVLTVATTLLLKKVLSPRQDIRKHQAGMSDGFSGRGLDEKVVTPFFSK